MSRQKKSSLLSKVKSINLREAQHFIAIMISSFFIAEGQKMLFEPDNQWTYILK